MTVTFPHAFRTAVTRLFAPTRTITSENLLRNRVAQLPMLAAVCLLALGAAVSAQAQVAPTTNVGSTSATQSVTLTITTAGTINSTLGTGIQVVTQGISGLDFNYATGGTCLTGNAYTVNQTCTVDYTFSPTAPGLRMGAVELFTASGTAPIAVAYISGTGTGTLAGLTGSNITTVAGNGTPCTTSSTTGCLDGGAATSAELNHPWGIAVDGGGNLYFSDPGSKRVRKVTAATGVITTVAGNGTCTINSANSECFSGDNGPATSAPLNYPQGLAIDGAGNLYITDTTDIVIRKVSAATGIITTVTGNNGASDVCGPTNSTCLGDGGPAASATIGGAYGLAVDGAGNLYIADTGKFRIRKITAATGIITTVAGTGAQSYSGDNGPATSATMSTPYGLAVDGSGNLYIADQGNNVIRKVTAATGIITTVAGTGAQGYSGDNGPATSAELYYPYDVKVDAAGNLYIADASNERIRMVSAATGIITTVAGNGYTTLYLGYYLMGGYSGDNGLATSAELNGPTGIALDGGGNLYVVDSQNNRIREVTASSTGSTAQTITFPPPTSPVTYSASPVTLTATASSGLTVVYTIDASSTATGSISGSTLTITSPGSLVIDANQPGNSTYAVAPQVQQTIVVTAGTNGSSFTAPTTALSSSSATQTLYVAITTAGTLGTISVLTQGVSGLDYAFVAGGTCATGTAYTVGQYCTVQYTFTPQSPGLRMGAVVLTSSTPTVLGTSYIAGVGTGPQLAYTPGTITTVAGNGTGGYSGDSGAATSAKLWAPYGVAVDGAGNLYIADSNNSRIREVTVATGIITTVAGTGSGGYTGDSGAATSAKLYYPNGVSVDGAGNLYIADFGNNRIRKVTAATGIITTVAGTGTGGYSGDNGLATSAVLNSPYVVSLDGAGNLYIADRNNNLIRKVAAATGIITTVVGNGTGGYSGDNGAATSAELNHPDFVAVDGAGNLYIADQSNQRIRKVTSAANSINFPTATAVGSTDTNDGAYTLTLSNIGNTALTFPVPTTGTNPSIASSFTIGGSSTCPQLTSTSSSAGTLASGASCTDIISFTPVSQGSLGGSLVTTSNSLNSGPGTIFGNYLSQGISLTGSSFIAAPTVTGVSPSTGAAVGGTVVTITGTNLSQASISFGTSVVSFTTDTGTSITVTAPAGVAGTTVDITVGTPGGISATSAADKYTFAAPTATQAIASKTLTQNYAASFTPVTGSGGLGTLTYSVSPALPTGLTLSTSTGAITGTATGISSATTYTITVTDSSSDTATNTFSLTVNAAVSATQAVATTLLTQNKAATSFTPVTGANGTTPLTYSVLPALPTGLSLNTSTGAITGTATGTSSATTYTVTVTDANGATATRTFSLTVNAAVSATQAVSTKSLTQNYAAVSFTPVTGSNGTGTLAYSVSPTLPTGLSFNTSTGAITGTATVTSSATTYTVTVTDTNSASATNTFSLTVNTAVSATQAVATTLLTQNKAATSFTPVTGANGTTPLSYSVSPALPTGLSISTSTGAITGTATGTSLATTYTVTVTDANSATATKTFSLTVSAAVTATQAVAITSLTQNKAATSFTPITGANGTGTLSYSISPTLPTGLSFNTSTGAITGTATGTSSPTTYTVTVTDTNSATATSTFSLTVNIAVSATQAVATNTLTLYLAATSFTPVTGSGGTGTLSYSVSPTLPPGLSFSTSTGAITGTPTAISSAATYTVTVTDNNSATAINTFSLAVGQAAQAITAFAPTTPVTYGVSPITLTATGGASGNPVTFSVISGPGSVSGTNNATLTVTGAGTIVVAANQIGNTSYLAAPQVTASIVVNKAALTVTANPITIAYGQTLPAYTTSITGFVNGDSSAVVSGTASLTTSPATPTTTGAYTITASQGSLAATNYSFTFVNANLTINPAGVIVTLVPNHTTGNAATNFTYTATVTSVTSGTPTGTISITATATSGGPFSYGPYTLSGGVAAGGGKMSGAGNGPVTVTASYSGDTNFVANLGTTLITLGTANYTLAASPSSLTVTRGTPASTTITMTPLSGYVGTASFSCGSLPAFTSCIFSPASLTTTDGVTPQTAVMTIYTLAPSAQHTTSTSMLWIPGAMLALLVFIGRRRMSKRMQSLLTLLVLATLALSASGCGTGGFYVTPTGADNISVTVSAVGAPGTGSSNLNQTLNLNITIQ